MQITINGEKKDFKAGTSLLDVLVSLNLESKVMAAAVNMEIVKQDQWGLYILQENDTLELLDFVGGG